MAPNPTPTDHSQWFEWARTMISVLGGFAAAYVLELVKTHRSDKRKREGMEKAIYWELFQLFHAVNSMIKVVYSSSKEKENTVQVMRTISTSAYETAKHQPELFYQIDGAHAIDGLYLIIENVRRHLVFPTIYQSTMDSARMFISQLQRYIEANEIKAAMFKRYNPSGYEIMLREFRATDTKDADRPAK